MFRRRSDSEPAIQTAPVERVTSVLGGDTVWHGRLTGSGGVRIEGAFEGEISLQGLLVIGEKGRVVCDDVRAHVVVIAGNLKGNITARKVDIRRTGRVWGDVTTAAFATEEGAFLRGKITMEGESALEGEEEES
jgi:cytoskeletal protein CcmA (bactofilin family)